MARRLEDVLEAARSLSKEERRRLVDQLRQELEQTQPARETIDPASIIGLLADDPDLIDEVCESAMQSREHDPLRFADG